MKWFSLLRRLSWRFREQPHPKKASARPHALLNLEHLESRIAPAAVAGAPKIAGVTPADGSVLNNAPTQVIIDFSESMSTTANSNALTDASTYTLFNSSGNTVSFVSSGPNAPAVSSGPGGTNSRVTLTLSNASLSVDTYSLFVRADLLVDADEGLPVAPTGQLVAADLGRGNVATFAMPGNGLLGALSNYPGVVAGSKQPTPTAVAVADLDGDTYPELIVASQTTDQVAIFAGQKGGGYSNLPANVLTLPSGSAATAIVVGQFHAGTNPDIVVADSGAPGQVSFFLNQSGGPGDFSFANSVETAAGAKPVAMIMTDVNGDGKPDVVVANSTANAVNVLLSDSTKYATTGGFLAAQPFALPSLTAPTGLAVGNFNGDSKPDLVVSGTGGVAVLINNQNNTTPNQSNFNTSFLPGANTTSVATGLFRANASNTEVDILATTAANGGQIVGWLNATATPHAITGITNKNASPTHAIEGLANANTTTQTGLITIKSTGHGLTTGLKVTIANVQGDAAANGPWTITVVDADHFSLNGSNGNGAWTTGTGTWAREDGTITVTSVGHSLNTGDKVTIGGVQGDTAANGTWSITKIDDDHFSLDGSNGNGAWTATTGTWTPGTVSDGNTGLSAQFTAMGGIAAGVANPTGLNLADLDGVASTLEVAYADNSASGSVDVLPAMNAGVITEVTNANSNPALHTIEDVTNTNASPVAIEDVTSGTGGVITIKSTGHGLSNSLKVTISGVQGTGGLDTAANGTWTITVVDADHFSLNGSSYPAGATYTAATGTWAREDGVITIKSTGHGLTTGQQVSIAGVEGDTNANGTWTITFVDADHFSLNGSNGNGKWTAGTGQWMTPARSETGVITVRSPNHGLINGQRVTISGVLGNTNANGTFYISNVTTNTFDLVGSNGNGAADLKAGASWVVVPGTILGVADEGPGTSHRIKITSLNHGLQSGQQVTVSGVAGTPGTSLATAATGTFFVTRLDANTFLLNGTTFPSGSTWTANTGTWQLLPYLTDSNPVGLVLADTNGDKIPEAITPNSTAHNVSILLGGGANQVGNGAFYQSANQTISGTTAPQPHAVAVGDVNGDGIKDLVVADQTLNVGNAGNGAVSVLLGLAGGGYADPVSYTTVTGGKGRQPVAVYLAKLNNDGLLDIVTADAQDSVVSVLLNSSSTPGTFGAPTTFATNTNPSFPNTPTDVVVTDLNGDGKQDLIVAHTGSSNSRRGITVLLGNSSGASASFAAGKDFLVGTRAQALALADFNKDTFTDVAVADNNAPGKVLVLLGDGTGNLTSAPSQPTGVITNPTDLAVADFDNDGYPDLVVTNGSAKQQNLQVLLNSAGAGFTTVNTTLPNNLPIASVVTANLNQDAFPDVVVGLQPGIITGTNSSGTIRITSTNHGLSTGDVVTVYGVQGNTAANGTWTITVPLKNGRPDPDHFDLNGSTANGTFTANTTAIWYPGKGAYNNVFSLTGLGDGTFNAPIPASVGGIGAPPVPPSYLAVVNDSPFKRISTFTTGGTNVAVNLVANGDFEVTDLTGEQGNLDGWQVYNKPDTPGSAGNWSPAKGSQSPLSLTSVAGPSSGKSQAMLDEQDLKPLSSSGTNSNAASTYSGSHAFYQDILIPANATSLKLSFRLYVKTDALNQGSSIGNWSDTVANPTLNWQTQLANQQVRVDLMDSAANILSVDSNDVLQNLFQTNQNQQATQTFTLTDLALNVDAYKGKTVRLRVASANNQGKLIVGLDNVKLIANFTDSDAPIFKTSPQLRNPNFLASANTTPQTSDSTIIGQVADKVRQLGSVSLPGMVNNIKEVDIDVNNDGFGSPDDVKVTNFDAEGRFSASLAGLLPGVHVVPLRVVDRAGNVTTQTFTFAVQGPSLTNWQAMGPGPIDISSAKLDYTVVTGNITSIAFDPLDPTNNTIFVSSDNGGVWKSRDGGKDWLALTDNVTDPTTGQRVAESIGAMAVGTTTINGLSFPLMYAGTGVANTNATTGGTGILKSLDGGATWTVVGQNVFKGAHISKIVVDPNNAATAYVAVSWFDDSKKQPGVFLTLNAGTTWTNILQPASMFTDRNDNTSALGAGTKLFSVTDLALDPFDPRRLVIGIGDVGRTSGADANSTGVWYRINDPVSTLNNRWVLAAGGDNANIPNNKLPNGKAGDSVGRISIGLGKGKVADEPTVYVLMTSPPPSSFTPGTFDAGHSTGLYKNTDGFLNFTKVMLRQSTSNDPNNPSFSDIGLAGNNAANVGALLVDPTNPNVVYVGGSTAFASNDPLQHSPIRVDTGNMRDTTYVDPLAGTLGTDTIPNDGDDIDKAEQAEQNEIDQQNGQPNVTSSPNTPVYPAYKTNPTSTQFHTGAKYTGEGVYWYDLAQGGSHGGTHSYLPTSVNSLISDSQGRIYFGTTSGIWRGVPYGFGYDYSTGAPGVGILRKAKTINPPGMTFTKQGLNGNLEIVALTSVAIDPITPGQVYTTQLNSGSAMLPAGNGPESWVSLGLTFQDVPDGDPNGVQIRASTPAPNALSGTPTTLYRTWQFLDPNALQLQTSTDGGGSFSQAISAGISINDKAGLSLPFAVNPTKLKVGDQYFDQLLLGTDRVYLSNTSTNLWVAQNVGALSAGASVTALAFAPSSSGVYYAGTSDGLIFVQTPGANWPKRSNGLPAGARINGITVDPNNFSVAYAMLTTATGGGVYRTTNAGANWSKMSGLPDQPAYAMVIDPRPVAGAPSGFLYVGTQVGVFTSTDGGTTWVPLGKALPAAPVVDLQFNPSLNELVAAVQGRGAFLLSTQRSGPQVVSYTPTTPQNAPLTDITVTFNEPVDPRTFTTAVNEAARQSVVTTGLVTSLEGYTNRVKDLYVAYLHRATPPSNAEVSGWANALLNGQISDQGLVAVLISSGEYYKFVNGPAATQTPANDDAWLTQAYLDLFGRAPTGSDPTTAQLATLSANPGSAGRQMVIQAMVGIGSAGNPVNTTLTDEYLRNLVAGLYNKYLGTNYTRPAPSNNTTINGWVNQFDSGKTTVANLTATLLASTTFYTQDGQVSGVAAGLSATDAKKASPSAIAYGNFSGLKDSRQMPINDLVVVDTGLDKLRIYKGQVGGGYSSTPTLSLDLPAGAAATAVVVADFNGDGKPDIAVANTGLDSTGTNSVSVYMNTTTNGAISFGTRQDYNGGNNPTGIQAADMDGDNKIDLVLADSVANGSGNYTVATLLGNSTLTSTFNAATFKNVGGTGIGANAAVTQLTGLALADLGGGSTLPEVVVSGKEGAAVLLNNTASPGTLVYSLPSTRLTSATALANPATSVAIGNLDHSTNKSVVLTTDNVTPENQGGEVLIYTTNGLASPTFTKAQGQADPANPGSFFAGFLVGSTPRAVNVVDLNGDGLAEIAVVNNTANGKLTVLRNTTVYNSGGDTIAFASAVNYSTLGDKPVALALGDSNQDYMLDAAIANSDTGSLNFAVIPGLTPGTFRTSNDRAFLQAAYVSLFHRMPDGGAYNVWLPGLPGRSLVGLQGPLGSITPLQITNLDPSTNEAYKLTFAPQVLDGTYSLFLGLTNQGTAVRDFTDLNGTFVNTGNPMNQNGNTVNGEFPNDRFGTSFAVNNSDDGQFIAGLYHDLLGGTSGRQADTGGFLAFLGPVDTARFQALSQVAPGVVGSVENQKNIVRQLYLDYLHRLSAPPDSQVTPWQQALAAGATTEEQIKVAFLASPEYFGNPIGRGGNNDFATWLNQVYLDVVGRPVPAGDVAFWQSTGLNRTQIASNIVYGDEGLIRLLYTTWSRFFNRAPSSSEVSDWLPVLRRTNGIPGQLSPYETLQLAIVGTNEFFILNGNSNKTWSTAMYTKLLGRPANLADPNGSQVLGLYNAVLTNGTYATTRRNTIATIVASDEYRNRVIAQFYVDHLGRTPSAAEVASWLPTLKVTSDQRVLAKILSSAEYSPLAGSSASNLDFLNKLYLDLLGRSPDSSATGPGGFLDYLNNNSGSQAQLAAARENVAFQVLNSVEYRRILAATFLKRYLGVTKASPLPNPDTDPNANTNLETYVNLLNAGATWEQVLVQMLGTPEYFPIPTASSRVFP